MTCAGRRLNLKTLPLSRHGYLLHRQQPPGEKVGETPEFGIPSLVLSSDLALSSPSLSSDLLSFSNAANWQLIKTFLRETLSIGILSAISEN